MDVARCTVVSVLIILCLHDYVCIVYVIYYHLVVKCSVYCLIYVFRYNLVGCLLSFSSGI